MSYDYDLNSFEDIVRLENNGTLHNTTEAVISIFEKYFSSIKSECNGKCNNHGEAWKCNRFLADFSQGKTYKYLSGADAGYWVLGYFPTACFQTPDYVFAIDTNTAYQGRVSIDVNGIKPPNIIGKDIFVLNMNNLNKVIAGGQGNFYSSSDYACDENAKYGGPACSSEYLIKKK